MNTGRTLRASSLASYLLLSAAVACGGGDQKASGAAGSGSGSASRSTVAVSDADRAESKKVFETVCSACHGMTGRGDGPASAGLEPKPRDLGDAAWQKTISDEHVRNVITMGGAAVGKSPAMPAQPQLKSNPAVLEALIQHVRGLAR